MTGSPLTLACDDEASQILLEDLPAGPAGEACLSPMDGVELLFDNADGRLTRIVVDTIAPGGRSVAGEHALSFIAGLLGTRAAAAVDEAHRWDGAPVPLRVDEATLADLSRLARLGAARATSPVAGSPGWAVEASQLAGRAGLTARAAAEARRAMAGAPPKAMPAALIDAVAGIVQQIEPGLAKRLREHAALPQPGRGAAVQSGRAWLAVPPQARGDGGNAGELEWWLDPQTVPAGVFGYHVWPEADLTAAMTESGVRVEAEVLPDADRAALAACRARLVDPVRRAVICTAPFVSAGGSRVSAEIPYRLPSGGAWVEVADDPCRPVFSAQLRHIRRAMRWADAALLAGRRPPGPAEADWDRLAGQAWGRCAQDWSAAQDFDRAFLAAERARAAGHAVSTGEPPSAWAKDLAGHPALREVPFLAEILTGPAGWPAQELAGRSITTTTRRLSPDEPGATRSVAPWPTMSR
jgi:hypothetical protein